MSSEAVTLHSRSGDVVKSATPSMDLTRRAQRSLPALGIETNVAAYSYREAARINAANASDRELDALLAERKLLLKRQMAGTMSRAESDRLAYVRWSLDRIEDARHGHALDRLEEAVASYKRALSDLQHLGSTLRGHLPSSRR